MIKGQSRFCTVKSTLHLFQCLKLVHKQSFLATFFSESRHEIWYLNNCIAGLLRICVRKLYNVSHLPCISAYPLEGAECGIEPNTPALAGVFNAVQIAHFTELYNARLKP